MTQVPMPGYACGYCQQYDWNYNATLDRWECRVCTVNGRPEHTLPEAPILEGEKIEQWTDQILREYDAAYKALEDAKTAPDDGAAAKVVYMARLKKTERRLSEAAIRADVVSWILQIRNSTTKGDIYIDLPEVDIKTRIQW